MQPKGRVPELPRVIVPPRPGGFSLPRPPGEAGLPRSPEQIAPPLADAAPSGQAADLAPPAALARPARSQQVADLATASVLLALGVLVIVESVRMGIGWGSDGPEGGFVPFWLAVVLVLSCAEILVRALLRPSDKRFASGEQLVRVLTVLLPATAMIVVVPWLGLYVASALYMGAYMRFGGRHGWTVSIALPLVFVVVIFLVFERWFLVPLPKGPLEAWLGY